MSYHPEGCGIGDWRIASDFVLEHGERMAKPSEGSQRQSVSHPRIPALCAVFACCRRFVEVMLSGVSKAAVPVPR